MSTVAALFVEANGIYSTIPDVDLWPVERDARLYAGPWPVVAHPPCNQWVNFAALNWKRYGRKRVGEDGGCFASALESLRRYGGVLEHPAGSLAFAAHGIAEPERRGWTNTIDGLWVCEVWQSAYGHRARKRTWLVYCGTSPPHRSTGATPRERIRLDGLTA